jgi:hypothetical protein
MLVEVDGIDTGDEGRLGERVEDGQADDEGQREEEVESNGLRYVRGGKASERKSKLEPKAGV